MNSAVAVFIRVLTNQSVAVLVLGDKDGEVDVVSVLCVEGEG
jgi:hypothetical protein